MSPLPKSFLRSHLPSHITSNSITHHHQSNHRESESITSIAATKMQPHHLLPIVLLHLVAHSLCSCAAFTLSFKSVTSGSTVNTRHYQRTSLLSTTNENEPANAEESDEELLESVDISTLKIYASNILSRLKVHHRASHLLSIMVVLLYIVEEVS